jgi:hypothetical protein
MTIFMHPTLPADIQCFAGWLADIHDVNSQLCEHAKVAVVAYHTIEFT